MAITLNGTTGITTPGLSADNPTLTVDSANNRVGIGTTNPTSQKFEVHSDTSQNVGIKLRAPSYQDFDIEITPSTIDFKASSTNDIRFLFGGSEKIRIDDSGNIGIGTTNPISFSSNPDNPNNGGVVLSVYGSSPAINLVADTTSGYSLINFGRSGSGSNPYRAVVGYNQANDDLALTAYSDITFITSGQISDTSNERLRITSTGNVGIGTTNPQGKVEIKTGSSSGLIIDSEGGSIYHSKIVNSAGDLILGSRNATADTLVVSNRRIFFKYGASETTGMILLSSGYIGIGTDNPVTNLHVKRTAAQADNDGTLKIENDNANTGSATNASLIVKNKYGWSQFMQWEAAGLRIGSRGISDIGVGDVYLTAGADSVAMTLTASGNAGIGYTNPSNKLEVNGKAYFAGKIATQPILNNGSSTGYVQYPASGYGEFLQMIVPAGNYNSGSNANEYDLEGMPSSSSSDTSLNTYLLTVRTAGNSTDGGTLTWIVIVWGSSTSNFQTTLLAGKNVGVSPSISISRVDPGGGAPHKIRVSGNNNARIQSLTAIKLG